MIVQGGGFPRDDTSGWSDAMCCSEAKSGLLVPTSYMVSTGRAGWVEAGVTHSATYSWHMLNAGVSVTLGKGIGVTGTAIAAS